MVVSFACSQDTRGLKYIYIYIYPSEALAETTSLGSGVGENALALGELLAHIGHQTASIAQSELVGHVVPTKMVACFCVLVHSPCSRVEKQRNEQLATKRALLKEENQMLDLPRCWMRLL